MAKFIPYDYNQSSMIVINFNDQIQSGTFEHVVHYLVDHKFDLSLFTAEYKNDDYGCPAYAPAIFNLIKNNTICLYLSLYGETMFSFLKPKKFEPNFPIIDIKSQPDLIYEVLSKFASEVSEVEDEKSDLTYVAESNGTRISVGFIENKVNYVNYLTDQFNNNDKKKGEKLA